MSRTRRQAPKAWERWELTFLKRWRGQLTLSQMSLCLERTEASIKTRMKLVGMVDKRRYYSEQEIAFIRANHATMSASQLAEALGRKRQSIQAAIRRLGLASKRPRLEDRPGAIKRLREMVAEGWCNRCIADELRSNRSVVRQWRRRFGLPPAKFGGHAIKACPCSLERVKENTARQCREAGVSSLAEIRTLAFRDYARASGWPEDLRPRAVQVLNALYEHGPMSRFQLAAAIGMRTDYAGKHGRRQVLHGNGPGGTYTAELMRRGLVIRLGRLIRTGKRKGQHAYLYALPIHLQRGAS